MPDPVASPSSSPPAAPPPVAAPPAPVSSAPTPPSPASTPPTPPTTPAPPPVAPQASARPSYIPESFWDATAGKVKDAEFAAHYNEIATRIAAEDSRKLTLPQNPDAYKVELPKDFTPPQGVEFKFNDGDPLLSQAKAVAHELGIPQEGFSKLLGLYAGAQVASQAQIEAARAAEVSKLGATGPARVDAVTRWAKATLGDAEGAQFASRMFTASDVMNAERLIARMTGGGNFKSGGREPPEQAGKLPLDQVEKMPLSEQLAYARQFSGKGRAA